MPGRISRSRPEAWPARQFSTSPVLANESSGQPGKSLSSSAEFVVGPERFELSTNGLKVHCSTS